MGVTGNVRYVNDRYNQYDLKRGKNGDIMIGYYPPVFDS